MNERSATVVRLGIAQTLAWASSYYLPAILAVPIARDLGIGPPMVFGAFSLALIVAGLLGQPAGRLIDRRGGRLILSGSNGLFALGLAALGLVEGIVGLFTAWFVIGLAMSGGLYEGAFATIVRLYGATSRNLITGVTLFAGFASTVGWPLTAWLEVEFGWRVACWAWAALHLLLALPLNLWLPERQQDRMQASGQGHASVSAAAVASDTVATVADVPPLARPRLTAVLLSYVFTAIWFVSTAMAAHLPQLMQATGTTLAVAVMVGALVGPAQVAGRLLEFGLLRRFDPILSARIASLGQPCGALALVLFGPSAAIGFALLHGAGNGIMTIAKGTVPLALFGSRGFGARQGLLMMPSRIGQAFAPLAFGLALDAMGAGALWLSAALGASAFLVLMWLPRTGNPRPGG